MLTCDRRGLLEANLATLLQQSRPFERLFVVDNGSSDGSREWLESLGSVEVIALSRNLGFAAAMNRGIEVALADRGIDLIASINNDVRLDADWHREALAALGDGRANKSREEGRRKVGSVATLMLQQDDPARIDSAGIEWHGSGRARNRWHGADVGELEEAAKSGRVWGASAAAALYSRELFESIGGFDETFFAYQDDVDLAMRAHQAGFGSWFAPRAIGWHLGHGSNKRFALGGTRADFLNSRNRLAVMASARREGQPLPPMLRLVAGDLLRSIRERRAPAVWLGTAHGVLRLPRSAKARRTLGGGSSRVSRAEARDARLTVVVLTLDEEEVLPGLLASIPGRWGVLIADGGSRDRTREVAAQSGARVIDQDVEAISRARGNFDVARNVASSTVSSEWILFLDADERLTPELVAEIEQRLGGEETEIDAFTIPRRNIFWGRPCRLLGEDRQLRLVRRGASYRYGGVLLHQPMQVQGHVGELEESMIHLNVRSWRDVVRRLGRYVPQQARVQEKRPRLIEIIREPYGLFRYYYIENQARKDGLRGLAMSLVYAFECGLTLTLSWARRRADA